MNNVWFLKFGLYNYLSVGKFVFISYGLIRLNKIYICNVKKIIFWVKIKKLWFFVLFFFFNN